MSTAPVAAKMVIQAQTVASQVGEPEGAEAREVEVPVAAVEVGAHAVAGGSAGNSVAAAGQPE